MRRIVSFIIIPVLVLCCLPFLLRAARASGISGQDAGVAVTASPAFCAEGDTVVLTAESIDTVGVWYVRWQESPDGTDGWTDTDLSGADGLCLTFTATAERLSRWYRAVLTDLKGTVFTSGAVRVELLTGPKLTCTVSPASVKEGETVTFTARAEGTAGNVKYRWERSLDEKEWTDTVLPGWQTNTLCFSATAARLNYAYRCAVTDDSGTHHTPAARAEMTSGPNVTCSVYPASAGDGETVTFTVRAEGTAGNVKYRWERSLDEKEWTGTVLPGWQTDTLCFPATAARLSYAYRCAVTDTAGTVYSPSARAFFTAGPALTVTCDPASAREGETVTISVSVDRDEDKFVFRWQKSADGSSWTGTTLPGCRTDTLRFAATALRLSYYYRCAVTYAGGTRYTEPVKVTYDKSPRYRALLVGQNSYNKDLDCTDGGETIYYSMGGWNEYTIRFRPLNGCIGDMEAFSGALSGLENGFAVTTLTDAAADGILRGISSAFSAATDNDISLFYYAGHGFGLNFEPDTGAMQALQGGLVGTDSEVVKLSELLQAFSRIRGRVILILDSCHSGAAVSDRSTGGPEAFDRAVIDAFKGYTVSFTADAGGRSGEFTVPKYMVMTACRYLETSSEGYNEGHLSGFFTYGLVKGLGCSYPGGARVGAMPADADGDGILTLYEAWSFASDYALSRNSRQHAMYYGSGDTKLFFR